MRHHDEWVKVAMADDSLVVDLLLRLHRHPAPPPPTPPLHLRWTVRQRRSMSVPRHNVHPSVKSERHTASRASPSTPLSWSGGATSATGGAAAALDCYEDNSSCPAKPSRTSRSKVANPTETTITRKARRKKTLAELKDEENLLLRERKSLKNELASLRLIVEKHRATNKRLKRLKLDLESKGNSKTAKTPNYASSEVQDIGIQGYIIALPDLNFPVDKGLSSSFIH